MKKSKKPSIRIKRAVKVLSDANHRHDIGNALLEQIIQIGVEQVRDQLSKMDRSINHFIGPGMWEHCIEILEENLEINSEKNQTEK